MQTECIASCYRRLRRRRRRRPRRFLYARATYTPRYPPRPNRSRLRLLPHPPFHLPPPHSNYSSPRRTTPLKTLTRPLNSSRLPLPPRSRLRSWLIFEPLSQPPFECSSRERSTRATARHLRALFFSSFRLKRR